VLSYAQPGMNGRQFDINGESDVLYFGNDLGSDSDIRGDCHPLLN